MSAREALLKPEFRDWYPGLIPGVWCRASWVAEDVLKQQRSRGPLWALDERVLSGAHFLFRGGRPSGLAGVRRRRGDRPRPAARKAPAAHRRQLREEVGRLVRAALGPPSGARPRRFPLAPSATEALLSLAAAVGLPTGTPSGPWFVVEGRRPLRRRGSSTRALPLVYRDGTALVMESWQGARALAALLNWCDLPSPAHLA